MRESHNFDNGIGRVIGLDIEMRSGFGARRLDVAPFHRSGQHEVEFSPTRRRVDLHLAYVRVPRQLGEQSKTDGKRGVAERRRPPVVAADGRGFIGVHDMRAERPGLERILIGHELRHRSNRVINGSRL